MDEVLEGAVDGEVVGGLVVVADAAGVVIFCEILRAGEAEDVAALGEDGPEEELKANGAFQHGLTQQFHDLMMKHAPHLRWCPVSGKPATQQLTQALLGDALGGEGRLGLSPAFLSVFYHC